MITESKLTTNRINGVSPTVPARQPEWLTTLRTAIARKITPDVIEQMLDAQIAKALKGDQKALKFVLELADRQPTATQPVHATQNVFHIRAPAANTNAGDDPLALKIYAVLEASGPINLGQIAAQLGEESDQVHAILSSHPWFHETRRPSGAPTWSIRKG